MPGGAGFRAAGYGTINNCHFDLGGERGKFAMKDINQTRSFNQQAAQFWKNRAFLAGLKIGSVSTPGFLENASRRELCQVPLQTGWPDA